jgi:circadian clock protein KaiB
MAKESKKSARKFEEVLEAGDTGRYVLRLFVTGMTPRSQRAVENIQKLCQEHLAGQYELEIVDIYQQPTLARNEQIIAAPTLVKKLPLPLRKLLGDLSDPGRVLIALGLKVEKKQQEGS